jgi:hypothetical protein
VERTIGASGHPQMTADAIRAAADFQLSRTCGRMLRAAAYRARLINHTAALTPDLRIMDFSARPELSGRSGIISTAR